MLTWLSAPTLLELYRHIGARKKRMVHSVCESASLADFGKAFHARWVPLQPSLALHLEHPSMRSGGTSPGYRHAWSTEASGLHQESRT